MNRFDEMEKKALCDLIDRSDKTLSNYSYSYYAEGGEVWKFEKEFAKWLGRKYCVTVNSGTSALMVAIKALQIEGIGDGHYITSYSQKVSIPAYTFVADAEAVLATNNNPVFEDISPQTYCMNQISLHPKSDIAIPVHTLGNVINPDFIKGMRESSYRIQQIEDCAQCVGGMWKGKRAGTFGDIAIFSFQGTKTISVGEGGMIAMDDEELYERCCSIRNHGDMYKHLYPNKRYPYLDNILGYNLRMTELQACVGRCQLKKVNKFVTSFKNNAELIFELLPEGITPPYIPKEVSHAYFILCCLWRGKPELRNKFLEKLNNERKKASLFWKASNKVSPIGGVSAPPGNIVGAGYSRPLYDYPIYRKYKSSCPNTEELIKRSVWIDLHRFTIEEKILREMELFNKCYRQIVGKF